MDNYLKQMEVVHYLLQTLLQVVQAEVKPSLWDYYNGS